MKLTKVICLFVLVGLMTSVAMADTLISKFPDGGPWWNPVGNAMSYVYADCFIAPGGADNTVTTVGTWLEPLTGAPNAIVQFQVWGDAGGPNCNDILASSDSFSTSAQGLNLHTLPVTSGGGILTAGSTYWFIVTGWGLGDESYGSYRTGSHTQNSTYQDNCTFWYSNQDGGCAFDGQNLTPEMAFEVLLTAGNTATENLNFSNVKALYR